MMARMEEDPYTRTVKIWFFVRPPTENALVQQIIRFDAGDFTRRIEDIDLNTHIEPSLTLAVDELDEIVRLRLKQAPETTDAVADARKTRDRLLTLVETLATT